MDSRGKKSTFLGDVVSAPFNILNFPFKTYRQYYGRPKFEEKYTGSNIQKLRLKKIIKKISNCEELPKNDWIFMNMVNDFLTQEGQEPIDSTNYFFQRKCEGKKFFRYVYNKRSNTSYKSYNDTEKKVDKEEKTASTFVPNERYSIYFFDTVDVKLDSNKKFNRGGNYIFKFLGEDNKKNIRLLKITNEWFDREEKYLILATDSKYIFNNPRTFKIYVKNLKEPKEEPKEIGTFSLTIRKK